MLINESVLLFNVSYNVAGQNMQFRHLQSFNTVELPVYAVLQDLNCFADVAVFCELGVSSIRS